MKTVPPTIRHVRAGWDPGNGGCGRGTGDSFLRWRILKGRGTWTPAFAGVTGLSFCAFPLRHARAGGHPGNGGSGRGTGDSFLCWRIPKGRGTWTPAFAGVTGLSFCAFPLRRARAGGHPGNEGSGRGTGDSFLHWRIPKGRAAWTPAFAGVTGLSFCAFPLRHARAGGHPGNRGSGLVIGTAIEIHPNRNHHFNQPGVGRWPTTSI